MKKLLRLSEVAELLSCSVRTVYRLIGEASLLGIQIRGGWRVDPSDLQDYIDRQKQQHAEDFGCIQDYSSLV